MHQVQSVLKYLLTDTVFSMHYKMNSFQIHVLNENYNWESDNNIIWQGGNNCRYIITRMQLIVPRITFNSEGQSLYVSKYVTNKKWTYLREEVNRSNTTSQRAGHFNITSGISKPRYVFVFIINDANIDSQTANPFLYNTFSVSTDPRTLMNCHLVVANGNEYPELHYQPSTDMTRVYRDVLKYVHKNNEYGEVIYQTPETVFHRDIQTPRRELKIRRAAEYF